MDEFEIDRTLKQAKKFLKDNRPFKIIPELKGKFGEYPDGRVVPLDDEARLETLKNSPDPKHSPWWGFKGGKIKCLVYHDVILPHPWIWMDAASWFQRGASQNSHEIKSIQCAMNARGP